MTLAGHYKLMEVLVSASTGAGAELFGGRRVGKPMAERWVNRGFSGV